MTPDDSLTNEGSHWLPAGLFVSPLSCVMTLFAITGRWMPLSMLHRTLAEV